MEEIDYKHFTVLVVDDEEDNLDAFRFSFRKTFNLSYANGGVQALDLLGGGLEACFAVSKAGCMRGQGALQSSGPRGDIGRLGH
jgi:CheY-like chemotaxis protein